MLLAQTQLQEKDLVDAEYELAEASSQLQLMNNVNQKFNQLINTNSADRLEQYIDDWTESPFVSMESSGLLELEYWFNQENVQNLTIEPTAMVAAMTKRMTKLTKDAEQEHTAAKQALIAAKTKQSTTNSSNALISRVIELNVWPYLMCLAFALKIARKRII